MSIARSLAILTLALFPTILHAQPLPVGDPEELGFSSERLTTMRKSMERFVDDGQHAGVSWLVARHGKIVSTGYHGLRDVETTLPMESDTIVRVYSMSKIVTAVAALILLEEGYFDLDTPAARFLPELAKMQVMVGGTADDPLLATAKTPITINHLLTHTSGFHYGDAGQELSELFRRAELTADPSLESFVKRAATIPLAHHPGEAWRYGISLDVLGRIIEVASDKPFEVFLKQRIFNPLGMVDTGFSVPSEERDRLAKVYEWQETRLVESDFGDYDEITRVLPEAGKVPPMGGGGLFSTIGDYARLSQMLLNGGHLDGQHILGRKTVELMTTNRLNHLPQNYIWTTGARGMGLGVGVVIDAGQSPTPTSLGQFGWAGAATTNCFIDPEEEIVALIFAQHFPYNEHRLMERFATGYLQALVN